MGEPCRLISLEEYEEYKELSSKCLQLEKKLDIAVKALKEIYGLSTEEMDFGFAWSIVRRCIKQIEEVK